MTGQPTVRYAGVRQLTEPAAAHLPSILLGLFLLTLSVARAQESPARDTHTRSAPSVSVPPTAAIPDVVDLPALLGIVRDSSPRLALERQAIAGAEADRITAGAYPNPTLSAGRFRASGGRATLFEGSRQDQAMLDVPVLIAGQRTARLERAEREIEAALARVAAGASALSTEAVAAFVALLAAQERAALAAGTSDEVAWLRNIVAGRESSGVASRYDLMRLDVELGGSIARLDEAKANVADRSGALATLLGLANWRPRAAAVLSPMTLDADALVKPGERAATSPATIAAMREESAARSGVEVARRERWPTTSVNVGRSWTGEPYGAANFLGLSIEIPIFDTRRGPLAKAQSDATAAALRRGLTQAEIAANLEQLANVITARQLALQRFEQDATARLPVLKQMAEDAYRLGRGSILELLDSTRARYELLQVRIDLIAALLEAQLRFLATTGDLHKRIGMSNK
jgi:outer membrane protein, heavy metal efflux system